MRQHAVEENYCGHGAADIPNNEIVGREETTNPISTTLDDMNMVRHQQMEASAKGQAAISTTTVPASSSENGTSATTTTLIHRKKKVKDNDKATTTVEAVAPAANSKQSRRSRIPHRNGNKRMVTTMKKTASSSNSILSYFSSSSTQSKLRIILFVLVVCIATGVISYGVYYYIYTDEYSRFQEQFTTLGIDIIDNLRVGVDRKLNSINTLSTSITNIAQATNQTFPFVTIPNFSVLGSNVRVLADALIIHWLPLVSDHNRKEWEQYSYNNRYQIDVSHEQDSMLRDQQDIEFGYNVVVDTVSADEEADGSNSNKKNRRLSQSLDRLHQQGNDDDIGETVTVPVSAESSAPPPPPPPPTIDPNFVIQDDDSGFHTQIYNVATEEPLLNGTGPYLPIWQRSPVNMQKQKSLNIDFSKARVFQGILQVMLNDHYEGGARDRSGGSGNGKVVLNRATIPTTTGQANFNANLLLGQYRHDVGGGGGGGGDSNSVHDDNEQEDQQPNDRKYLLDPLSFLAYPVYDTFNIVNENFNERTKFVGVVASNIYWRLYFENVLPSDVVGIVVVMENSFNQTFTYRIDGKEATFLGEGDTYHDKYYEDYMEITEIVNEYVQKQASTKTRAYTTVPLHDTYGIYQIRIYPTKEFQDIHVTNKPIIYGIIVACLLLCMLLSFIILLSRVISQKAKAKTEKDLTSYFAHELRNPLSAIDSALQTILDANSGENEYNSNDGESDIGVNHQQQIRPQKVAAKDGDDELQEVLAGIRSCTDFMSSMMNNLLDARQLEEGRMVLHATPLSLSGLIMDVHRMLESSVKPNVIFEYRCNMFAMKKYSFSNGKEDQPTGEGDWVVGDAHRLKQVLANVVMNAIKYTTAGSIVLSVWWSNEEGAGIRQGNPLHNRRRHVCFKCEDTGSGIPKKGQQVLFQKFVQREGAPGAGIGLALAKSIVDMMDGTIRLESDPTKKPGTTCIISIPLKPANSPSSKTDDCNMPNSQEMCVQSNGRGAADKSSDQCTTAANSPCVNSTDETYKPSAVKNLALSGCADRASKVTSTSRSQKSVSSPQPILEHISILIVDDIKMNRMMLKRRLQKLIAPNCVVKEASTGEEALRIIEGAPLSVASASAAAYIMPDVKVPETGPTDATEQVDAIRFDAIVMDQYMEEAGGVIRGTDAVQSMRKIGIDSYIVGCSGNDMMSEFLDAGADVFWGKPLPPNQTIIEHLRHGLERKRKSLRGEQDIIEA